MTKPHTLIIGATGMLRSLCLQLADQPHTLSILARDPHKLSQLVKDAQHLPGDLHPIAQDYADSEKLAQTLTEAIKKHGPIQQAICWIHSHAPHAPLLIAKTIAQHGPCDMLHLHGSAFAHPNRTKSPKISIPGLTWRTITLGFVLTPTGSRWLTHEEICQGTLQALQSTQPHHTIGVVRPWSARP